MNQRCPYCKSDKTVLDDVWMCGTVVRAGDKHELSETCLNRATQWWR